jgi:shikimate dehydrogenase
VLLQRAEAAGAATATGIDLLVHQAVEQVRLMTGLEVEAERLLEIAVAEVRRRAGPGGRSG